MKSPSHADGVPRARTLEAADCESVFGEAADYFGVDAAIFARRGDGHLARAAAARLTRRLTTATPRELSVLPSLIRPESVSNLTRRFAREPARDGRLKREIARIAARPKND